jgi:hypothetical protein
MQSKRNIERRPPKVRRFREDNEPRERKRNKRERRQSREFKLALASAEG